MKHNLRALAHFFLLPDVEKAVESGARDDFAFMPDGGGNSENIDEITGIIAVLAECGRTVENENQALFELYETLILSGHPIPDGSGRRCCVRVIAGADRVHHARAQHLMEVCIQQGLLSWGNSQWAQDTCEDEAHQKNRYVDLSSSSNELFAQAAKSAARAGNLGMLELLARNIPSEVKGERSIWVDDSCPISAAAEGGHIDCIQYFLNIASEDEWMDYQPSVLMYIPLMHHAAIGGHMHAVKWLISQGFDINKGRERGSLGIIENALIYAKEASIPLELIEMGAHINNTSPNSIPLHVSIHRNRADVFKVLIEKGADVEAIDATGRQPFLYAAQMGHAHFLTPLSLAGANIDAADKKGDTALHWACRRDLSEVYETLKTLGVNTSLRNHNGETALDVANGATRSAIERDTQETLTPQVHRKNSARARL